MKKLILGIIGACIMGVCSCTYDYEMPDTSNLSRQYSIESKISDELISRWEEEVGSEYNLNLSNPEKNEWKYLESKWELIVIEKDKNGTILYEGEPRSRVEYNTYSMDIAYICYVRLNRRSEYLEYARFKIPESYQLNSTPIPTNIYIDDEMFINCIVDYPTESDRVYAYNIECDSSIYNMVNSLGLSFETSDLVVTEKDENGNILYQGDIEKHYGLEDYHISAKGTITVEVLINLNQGGILKFNEAFLLKDFGNKTLLLTLNNDYTLDTSTLSYIYSINFDSNVSQLFIKMANSNGYRFSRYAIIVTEKDNGGNVLYKGELNVNQTYQSQVGAKTIEINIDIYGYDRDSYPFVDEIKIGSIIFTELFCLSDINNKVLILTTADPYIIEISEEIKPTSYSYSISLDSSTTNAINDQLLNPANCRFGHYEIIVTEKDADGNVLYQGEYEIHTTRQSEKGAKTLEAAIDVYGYDKDTYPFGKEKKIGSIIFTEIFNLAEIENPFILSAYEYAHRWERYY